MLFNSIPFLLFFFVVTSAYFIFPHKYRWFLLLAASCYFYMFFIPVYILILGFTIVIDYFAGIYLEKTEGKKRKVFLILSLIANIGVLSVFKYYNFLNDNLTYLLNGFKIDNPVHYLNIILPIGLSFHTFQAMSYTIEVYRGRQKAEHHFGIYALYVMFYPQLVAGPIERPQNLIHQFYEKHYFNYERVTDGLKLIVWGLFKKIVIADRLAIITDRVFNNPYDYKGLSLIIAVFFFAFQIFCDFSGYSDIAIGTAKVMGFKLMTNFNRPYFSPSINEFWKRWHISLSSWFRDYLYIPLGGKKVVISRLYFNLFFVFLISGLWHGANWTFVIWGALNGLYLIIGLITKNIRNKISNSLKLFRFPKLIYCLQIIFTFILVCFSWIFFRAKDLNVATYIVNHLFDNISTQFSDLGYTLRTYLMDPDRFNKAYVIKFDGIYFAKVKHFLLSFFFIFLMEIVHIIQENRDIKNIFSKQPFWVRWAAYYAILFIIIFFGVFENRQFIYFQF